MTQTGSDIDGRDQTLKGWLIFISGLAVGAGLVVALLLIIRPQPVKDLQVQRAVADAKQRINARDYEAAVKAIDRVLELDPDNDFATAVRPMVEDQRIVAQQAQSREHRDRTFVGDRPPGASVEQQAVLAQLERKLPEVRFDNVGFADVLDFVRDVTSADIFVNWKALEAAGIDRNQPVSTRMKDIKFATALDLILRDLDNGKAKVRYVASEGVIVISTEADLQAATQPSTAPAP
jgi:hypothetical protein